MTMTFILNGPKHVIIFMKFTNIHETNSTIFLSGTTFRLRSTPWFCSLTYYTICKAGEIVCSYTLVSGSVGLENIFLYLN